MKGKEKRKESNKVVIHDNLESKDFLWVIFRKAKDGENEIILQYLDRYAERAEYLINGLKNFGWTKEKQYKDEVEVPDGDGDSYTLRANHVHIEKLGTLDSMD